MMDSSLQLRREHFSKRSRESDKLVLDESWFFTSLSCKKHCRETLAHRDLADILETDDIQDTRSTDDYLDTATQEELICGVMRSLAEEIGASDCSDSSQYSMEELLPSALESSWSSLTKDGSPTSKSCTISTASPKSFNRSEEHHFNDDIGNFLLEASDDELGISSSLYPDSLESCDDSGYASETVCLEEDSVVDMKSIQSESVWLLDNTLDFSCADDFGDRDWLKRPTYSLEILILPASFKQSSIQEVYALPVLEAGVGS